MSNNQPKSVMQTPGLDDGRAALECFLAWIPSNDDIPGDPQYCQLLSSSQFDSVCCFCLSDYNKLSGLRAHTHSRQDALKSRFAASAMQRDGKTLRSILPELVSLMVRLAAVRRDICFSCQNKETSDEKGSPVFYQAAFQLQFQSQSVSSRRDLLAFFAIFTLG